jgi:KDO2-lipid IV(A) lauroyltransferase
VAFLRKAVEYGAYRLLTVVVPLLPRFVVVAVGRALGGCFYWLSPRTRRVGLENLRRVFPDRRDHRRILRESAKVQAVALLDALWSVRLSRKAARRVVEIDHDDLARWEKLFGEGRGAVVATAHFGSWEMLNLGTGALKFPPVTFIARPVNNEWIDRHLRRTRERTGNTLVYRINALLACMAALRAGEIVASVIDMAIVPAESGVFLDFLGTPACTAIALPTLAVRRNAPLFFAVCRPVRGGLRYVLDITQIEFDPDGDRDEQTLRAAQALNRELEKRIREYPEYWLWGYKRWKWRPSEVGFEHYPSYSLWVEPRW